MSDLAAFLLTAFCTSVMFGIWYFVLERVPLEVLGTERVRRVLKNEAAVRRQKILARGWTTRDEWRTILIRQQWREKPCSPASPDGDER